MPKSKTLSHVFDADTSRSILKLRSDGYIGELSGVLGSGKESYVFYSQDSHNREVAVKVHRHYINAFNGIPSYLRLRGSKTGGFFKRIDDWTRYEFSLLRKANEAGVNTPEPIRNYKNIIVMSFIGKDGVPAMMAYKDTAFDIKYWYDKITGFIIKMGKVGMIHGDLSPYNILNNEGEPYLIDFSQSLKLASLTKDYLLRDIKNINQWFQKLGKIEIMPEEKIMEMIGFDGG